MRSLKECLSAGLDKAAKIPRDLLVEMGRRSRKDPGNSRRECFLPQKGAHVQKSHE